MISPEIIRYSLKNLWKRKSRSFLTILSIFIGIATIFIFMSFGIGLYSYIEDVTQSSSANKIIVQGKGMSLPGLDDSFQLDDSDLRAVEKTAGVYDATGIYIKPAKVTQQGNLKYVFLMAYDPKKPLIEELFSMDIAEGRELQPGDGRKVVLGSNYLEEDKIFPESYDINQEIEIEDKKLRIVGFYESLGNPEDDSNIYLSNDYIDELYPEKNNSYAWIIAEVDIENIDSVIERVEDNVRKARGLDEGDEDFFVQSYTEMIDSYSGVLDIVIGFIILIALISVVVSAINTANTMVTSVLERYQEIGIMKSIGARNSEILKLFLFESSFLGFVAGIIGVGLGTLFVYIAGEILNFLGWGFLSPSYSPLLYAGCILFAIITGAISGIAPAINASKTNPVDALRYE